MTARAPLLSLLPALLLGACAGQSKQAEGQEPPAGEPAFLDESPPLPVSMARAGRMATGLGTPTRLFLQLEGAQITKGPGSDASANLSYLCGGTFPPWDHQPFGNDRAEVAALLQQRVTALFSDFNIDVLLARPASAPYDMVVVGGTPALCGRPEGLGGLGPLDCDNLSLTDVAFVFAAGITALEGVAVAVAHEAGHAYGLPHTSEPCDVMSIAWCSGGSKRFVDEEMSVADPSSPSASCGLQRSNSWRRLREVLGPRQHPADLREGGEVARLDAGHDRTAADAAPATGCGVSTRGVPLPARSLLILASLAVLLVLGLRRAHTPVREVSDGHPRRDQLGHR